MSPSEHNKLTNLIIKDNEIAQLHYKFMWKNGMMATTTTCSQECVKTSFCDAYSAVRDQKILCLQDDFEKLTTIDYLIGMFLNPWVERK